MAAGAYCPSRLDSPWMALCGKNFPFLGAGIENAASNRMAGEKANQGRGRLSLLPGRVSSLIAGLPIRGFKGGINF